MLAPQPAVPSPEGEPTPRDLLLALGQLLAGRPPGPGLDWPGLTRLARRQGVAPLLFWQLRPSRSTRDTPVPPEVWRDLQADFYAAAAQGMGAEQQLAQVLATLAGAGVAALVIKGAATGAFYPDPGLRTYSDLDVLVPEAHIAAAEAALRARGYTSDAPRAWWEQHFQHLPPLMPAQRGLAVELHWRLDLEEELGTLPAEDLWQRARPWTVAGQATLWLDAVDAVLHLCRHAAVQHRLELGLRPLCDLVYAVHGWTPEQWQVLARRAGGYGLARPVYFLLILARDVLALDVPAAVLERLRPPESLPGDAVDWLLRSPGETRAAVPSALLRAGNRETPLARVRDLFWHLFLPRQGMAAAYGVPPNSPRIWLLYLWRPIHLLQKYGRSAWSAARGEPAARAAWQRQAELERWLRQEQDLPGKTGAALDTDRKTG